MEFSISYNDKLNVIVSHAVGALTTSGISSLIDDSIPLLKTHTTANYIADYSEGSAEGLSTDHIWQISVDCNRLSDYLTAKKLALVLKDDIEYGLGRMWQSFTEAKVPYEIQLFRTFHDAQEWVTN